jgi:hypothetical protein
VPGHQPRLHDTDCTADSCTHTHTHPHIQYIAHSQLESCSHSGVSSYFNPARTQGGYTALLTRNGRICHPSASSSSSGSPSSHASRAVGVAAAARVVDDDDIDQLDVGGREVDDERHQSRQLQEHRCFGRGVATGLSQRRIEFARTESRRVASPSGAMTPSPPRRALH